MTQHDPESLSLSRNALRVLIRLNIVMGFLIFALLVASVVAPGFVMRGLGVDAGEGRTGLTTGMRLIMVLGIGAVPFAHAVLTRLLAVVETVRAGDPFIAENAVRLRHIAWAVLGLELLHLTVGWVASQASSGGQPLDIDWNFSIARWLTVLLLFVLARVFEQGARMRDDLEGTV